jgi:hypothetical protein
MKKFLTVMAMLTATSAFAAEGMWMPQQIPLLGDQLKKAGLQIDPNRFADLTGDPMGAVISLGGCSASFVSPDGLAVTNHHCGFGALQFNSRPDRDLITNGFLAKTREEELPGGGTRIFVTTGIEDVTARMTSALNAKLSDYDREQALDRASKQLVEECEKPGGVRCRVASFFEGTQYLRTTQMEIRDVRLVYAPALGIGDFGGETDNWMWPRHTGDWSYLRAYVGKDGKPADYSKDNVPFHPAHYLKVATTGVQPGDMVIVAGYPGRTFRYRTAAEVTAMQDYSYPTTIRYATDLNNILREMGKTDKDVEIRNASRIKGNDNVLKNYTGTLEGFRKDNIVGMRQTRETQLASYIASHPDMKQYAPALDQMNALQQRAAATRQRDTVFSWIFRSSPMLSQARTLYRMSIERPKADIDRVAGFQQRDWQRVSEATARAQRTLEPKSDRAGLKYFLNESQKLPADQRIKAIDDAIARAGSIDALLDQLYANTKVGDAGERKAMLAESTAQLSARHDAMIDLAAALSPLDLETEHTEREIAGAMSRVRPQYMQALKAMNGGVMYPDANGTLRITFGRVEGYAPRDAVYYAPLTTVGGIAQKDTGSGEFNSPKALLDAIRAKNFGPYADPKLGEVPVNFLSTCDTTGGNSGSPTLNARGELTGLLFDGNYEALGSDFVVDPKLTRSIHVDALYMLWVMDAVDKADNLLQEMGITPKL